jgi:hypothetical protein
LWMMGRSAAWLVALPFAAAAWLSAHCLAYVLVPPAAEEHMGLHGEHMGLHAESGHAYFGYTPALVAFGLTLMVVGFGLCVGEGLRGRRVPGPPMRLLVLPPPVGFVVQEHVEHAIGSGAVPLDLVTEPTFLVGLALQLPFVLVALLLARAVHELGYGLGRVFWRVLAIRRSVRLGCSSLLRRLPQPATLVTPSVLALGHGQRAPPEPACL